MFRLHKIGQVEPMLEFGEKRVKMARDGSPVVIALDKDNVQQVVLRCWSQYEQQPTGRRQYDWRVEETVPGGILVPRKNALEFEAPVQGYIASDLVDMPASLGNRWHGTAERSYFFKFEDQTYARVKR